MLANIGMLPRGKSALRWKLICESSKERTSKSTGKSWSMVVTADRLPTLRFVSAEQKLSWSMAL